MRKGFCLFLAGAVLAISSIPLLPMGAGSNAQAASYCPLHPTKIASMNCTKHTMTPAMRHCRIECCGHHDSSGLPHLLAPHTVSLADFDISLVMMAVAVADAPVLKLRLLPFPVPPPRIS